MRVSVVKLTRRKRVRKKQAYNEKNRVETTRFGPEKTEQGVPSSVCTGRGKVFIPLHAKVTLIYPPVDMGYRRKHDRTGGQPG